MATLGVDDASAVSCFRVVEGELVALLPPFEEGMSQNGHYFVKKKTLFLFDFSLVFLLLKTNSRDTRQKNSRDLTTSYSFSQFFA